MSLLETTKFPLEDGQILEFDNKGREEVAGEIKPPHAEPVCYTIQGNWYRRRDGEPMTGGSGEVTTFPEFYKWRRERIT